MVKSSIEAQRKKDGFKGQKTVVLPTKVIRNCEDSPLMKQLFVTDIGFYPKAKFHYRERFEGVSQHILIYCVDGKGWLHFKDEEEQEVGTGEFLIIPADMPHRYGSVEEDPWSIYWIHFKGVLSPELVYNMTRQHTEFVRPVNFSDDRVRLFNTMYNTLENGYSGDNIGYINMCLWHYLSSFCYDNQFMLPAHRKEKDSIDRAIEFMQQHLDQTFSLAQLAEEVYLSPSHFSALFKKKTGYPPLEYFNHIKVQKACQYLQFTNLQVKEIAYRLGINDPFYFSRFFSNIMGQPPLEYRNRKR